MEKFTVIQTLTLSGIIIFVGYGIRRAVPFLSRVNIPAPVIGGLLVSIIGLCIKETGISPLVFDTSLQVPLMIMFFTTLGFGASFSLLKKGGFQIIFFLIVSTIFAILQNAVGIAIAVPFNQHPLFGVLAGSVTLTGGPATGLAFAPLFEQAGVAAAAPLAIAAAMSGIIAGGLIGSPIGTWIIEKHGLKKKVSRQKQTHEETRNAAGILEDQIQELPLSVPGGEDKGAFVMLKSFVIILIAMWCGSWISSLISKTGFTLPAYIGAMIVGMIFRNVDDTLKITSLSQQTIDDIGSVSLSLFIAMSLMTLKLWEIANIALPLLMIILAQIVIIVLFCIGPFYYLFGKDYDAAVMAGGFCGFMLGTTANSMANMGSLTEKYGPAPRAFLVIPIVGAFFIDLTNAVIITIFLNIFSH